MKSMRTALCIATATVLLPLLSACGGSASADAPPAQGQAATAAASASESSGSAAPAPAVPAELTGTASLTWPEGTVDFPLNVCASQGPNTIQGGGSTDEWDLMFDANLLEAGDEGTLVVSDNKQGMAVVYDATITSLTVNADGTFTGAGQDASNAPFTISGTCTVSW